MPSFLPSSAGDRLRRHTGRLSVLLIAAASLLAAGGCGSSYRPVVTAINPVGPAAQPTKYALAVSQPTATGPGLITLTDFAGDTVLNTTSIGSGPFFLNTDTLVGTNSVGTGYTLNRDTTLNTFSITPALIASQVLNATLAPGGNPNSLVSFVNSGGTGASVYVTLPARSSVAQLARTNTGLTQVQEIPVPANPVYTVGVLNAPRVYTLSQGVAGGVGQATAIETANQINTVSNTIPVGRAPVYGVMTADARRAFVMNQGDGTVSVINSQTNQPDTPIATVPVGVAPVWADLAPTRNELIVLNAGDGTGPGSVSVVSIPLCSATALATNPNCDPANPIDAVGFGTVLATIPVGVSPSVIAVLQDGTQAFVANTGSSVPCPPTGTAAGDLPVTAIPPTVCGTVSVINLETNTVVATVTVAGQPMFLAATTGTPTGKVYVTSTQTSLMTVLRTDTDAVQTYVDLQGRGQQVRLTAQ